jgi:hypothetical protein
MLANVELLNHLCSLKQQKPASLPVIESSKQPESVEQLKEENRRLKRTILERL